MNPGGHSSITIRNLFLYFRGPPSLSGSLNLQRNILLWYALKTKWCFGSFQMWEMIRGNWSNCSSDTDAVSWTRYLCRLTRLIWAIKRVCRFIISMLDTNLGNCLQWDDAKGRDSRSINASYGMQESWSPVCISVGWHQEGHLAHKTSHWNHLIQGGNWLTQVYMENCH